MAGKGPRRNGLRATRLWAKALGGAGWIAMFQGDYGAAKALMEEGLALYRRLGDENSVASCLVNLGINAVLGQHDLASIPSLIEEATELSPGLADPRTVASLSMLAGMLSASEGDPERAISRHEEGLVLSREVRDTLGESRCLMNMGLIEMARANHARAAALARENLLLAREPDDKLAIQYSLVTLGGVALGRGRPARAARLWGAAEAIRESSGIHLPPLTSAHIRYESLLGDARAQLCDEAFERAWAEGRATTQAEAVEYALMDEPPPAPENATSGTRPNALTRREAEVAALVARGLTNRRIAEELSISRRTVDTHVGRILKKSNLRSREQVAARAEQAAW